MIYTLPDTLHTNCRDTLVVEFQQNHHINYNMWELSPLLEHNYWCIIAPDQAEGGDLTVPVQDVVKIMKEQLGVVKPAGYYLDLDYDWPKALVGM
jgi:hypothetical protein